ncbi:MAG: hypothetical protein ACNS62_11565 [Candidatus Cyclobacteriaceae bacterium M3_2C_046]
MININTDIATWNQVKYKSTFIDNSRLIPYQVKPNTSVEKRSYKHVAIYSLAFAVALVLLNVVLGLKLWLVLALLALPLFMVLVFSSKTDLKVININENFELHLIKDKQLNHCTARIISKIEDISNLNFYYNPRHEIAKFAQLKDTGIISSKEFDAIKTELASSFVG